MPDNRGRYGIGITRTCCYSETNHDEAGIKWPFSVAPYHVIIVNVNTKNQELVELCEKLYGISGQGRGSPL